METGTFYCKLKVLLIGKCFCSLLHGLKCIQSLKFLILDKCCNNKIKKAQSRCEETTEDGEKGCKESGENSSDAAEIEIKTTHSGQISFLSQDATLFHCHGSKEKIYFLDFYQQMQ